MREAESIALGDGESDLLLVVNQREAGQSLVAEDGAEESAFLFRDEGLVLGVDGVRLVNSESGVEGVELIERLLKPRLDQHLDCLIRAGQHRLPQRAGDDSAILLRDSCPSVLQLPQPVTSCTLGFSPQLLLLPSGSSTRVLLLLLRHPRLSIKDDDGRDALPPQRLEEPEPRSDMSVLLVFVRAGLAEMELGGEEVGVDGEASAGAEGGEGMDGRDSGRSVLLDDGT